jgi:hypothetical protein
LKDARAGNLEESEDDAIDLTNLADQMDTLQKMKAGWKTT